MAFCYAALANEYTYFSTTTRITTVITIYYYYYFCNHYWESPSPTIIFIELCATFKVHLTPRDLQKSKLRLQT